MLCAQDYETLIAIMLAGRHGSVSSTLRAALFHYGLHFQQQGLLELSAGAFKIRRQ